MRNTEATENSTEIEELEEALMSIRERIVDTESYQWVPGGSLTVQGWKAVEGESAAILVLDEKGEPVKAEVKFYQRPDVV